MNPEDELGKRLYSFCVTCATPLTVFCSGMPAAHQENRLAGVRELLRPNRHISKGGTPNAQRFQM